MCSAPAFAQEFAGPYVAATVGSDEGGISYGALMSQDPVFRGAIGYRFQDGPFVKGVEVSILSPREEGVFLFGSGERILSRSGSDGGLAVAFQTGYVAAPGILVHASVGGVLEQVFFEEVLVSGGVNTALREMSEVAFAPTVSAGMDLEIGQTALEVPFFARIEYVYSGITTPRVTGVTHHRVSNGLWLGFTGEFSF